MKDIIKYNGYQVAASDLESQLAKVSFVLDCAVVGKRVKEDVSNNELPWACIVVKQDAPDASDDDRSKEAMEFVNQRVAGYKKLRGVTFVDQLPRRYVLSSNFAVLQARS